jgi:hypothetical protein
MNTKIEIIFKNVFLYPEHAGVIGNIILKRLKR